MLKDSNKHRKSQILSDGEESVDSPGKNRKGKTLFSFSFRSNLFAFRNFSDCSKDVSQVREQVWIHGPRRLRALQELVLQKLHFEKDCHSETGQNRPTLWRVPSRRRTRRKMKQKKKKESCAVVRSCLFFSKTDPSRPESLLHIVRGPNAAQSRRNFVPKKKVCVLSSPAAFDECVFETDCSVVDCSLVEWTGCVFSGAFTVFVLRSGALFRDCHFEGEVTVLGHKSELRFERCSFVKAGIVFGKKCFGGAVEECSFEGANRAISLCVGTSRGQGLLVRKCAFSKNVVAVFSCWSPDASFDACLFESNECDFY